MHLTCTGAITAQGPPSNCSNAVDSDSLKTNPVKWKMTVFSEIYKQSFIYIYIPFLKEGTFINF